MCKLSLTVYLISVLVIYCYITHYLQTAAKDNSYYLIVPVGQKLGVA